MADDWYTETASRRFQQIEAERAQSLADLQQARVAGDNYLAQEAVQRIADLDSAAKNLADLHSRYVQSQTPVSPPEISAEERAAKPWDKMNYDDALALARNSKYGKDLTHDDPNVAAGYRAVQARRQRGE